MNSSTSRVIAALIIVATMPSSGIAQVGASRAATSKVVARLMSDSSLTEAERWQRLRASKLPLIQPDDSAGYSLVTFAWRGDSATKRVWLQSPFAAIDAAGAAMERLPATHIWIETLRVRDDAGFSYSFVPVSDTSSAPPQAMAADVRDPEARDVLDNGAGRLKSVMRLNRFPSDSFAKPRAGVQRGTLVADSISSRRLGGIRRVLVYRPAPIYTRDSNAPLPLLVMTDGSSYTSELVPTPTIIDNLISSGAIPPIVAVFIPSPNATRVQDLRCNENWDAFLADELIPWTVRTLHASTDPSRRIIGGSSLGGLAAACVALRRPDAFRNVYSVSGSFHSGPTGATEWLSQFVAEHPPVPVRFFLRVGVLETIVNSATNWPTSAPTLLGAHRHLRTLLTLRGYRVDYGEFFGGHELLSSRWSLGEALPVLLR